MNRLLQNQKIYKRPAKRITQRSLHAPIAQGFYHIRNKTRRLKRLIISGFIQTYKLHFIGGGSVLAVFLILLISGIIPFGTGREKAGPRAEEMQIIANVGAAVSEPVVTIALADPENAAATVSETPLLEENSNDAGEVLGTGVHVVSREADLIHVVSEGETLSGIARFYNLGIENLALYNEVENPNEIYVGKEIRIPSYANEEAIQPRPILQNTQLAVANSLKADSVKLPAANLKISAEKEFNGTSLAAEFSFDVSEEIELRQFIWHLGNGLRSYVKDTSYTYYVPGTYKVYLEAFDSYGRAITSNELFIDVPYPYTYADSAHRFVTVPDVNKSFVIDGQILYVDGYDSVSDIFTFVAEREDGQYSYKASEAGYFSCTTQKGDLTRQDYLFVSPIDSVHVETNTLNWYRTQFNTGTLGNCGPAAVSMAAAWATEEYVPVINIRQSIGWRGDGGTNFEELIDAMEEHDVTAMQQHIQTKQDLFNIVDNGNIAIVLFHTGGVTQVTGDPTKNFFGKYYPDAVGHYVVIKGYSVDKEYFIVQDPIPSDWGSNSGRYDDHVSMIGRNRYYNADELLNSLRTKVIIKVLR